MTARREISRQEFLKITGGAAAEVAMGAILLPATASCQRGGGRETALITDFGAKGDGVHDDTEAILKAIDEIYDAGGGIVRVPEAEAFYKTTRAIDLRSDVGSPVRIVGEGDKSFIKNTATGMEHEFAPVFRAGLLVAGTGPYSGPGQDFHPIAPAEKGSEGIKPKSGRYRPGDMLLIGSRERYHHGDASEVWHPAFPQITLVEGVDDGEIKLADPLLDDHPDSLVAVFKYGVSHGSIENLRFEHQVEHKRFAAVAGGGCYRMKFMDLSMTRGVSVFAANGYARCSLDRIDGTVVRKGIELAQWSHSTTVRNVTLRVLGGVPQTEMMLFAAEAAHRMVYEECDVDVRGKAPDGLGVKFGIGGFLGGTRYNVMRRCSLRADKYDRGLSLVHVGDKPSVGNRIEDCEVIAHGAKQVISVAGTKHVITYNRADGRGAEHSIVLGGNSSGCGATHNVVPHIVKDFGENNTVEGNAIEDVAGVGPRV